MAKIKLNNNSYPIPNSALAGPTADFVAHLGTIAGSGLKVVIGGVEYGVDSNKVAGALSELSGVLGGLNSDSGDTESGNLIDFDGDYSKYEYVNNGDVLFVRVSDKVLAFNDLIGATVKYICKDRTGDYILTESDIMSFEDVGITGVNGVAAEVLIESSTGSRFWAPQAIISVSGDLNIVQSMGIPFTQEGTYFIVGNYHDEIYYIKSLSCLTE